RARPGQGGGAVAAQEVRGPDPGAGRQEDQGDHGAVSQAPRPPKRGRGESSAPHLPRPEPASVISVLIPCVSLTIFTMPPSGTSGLTQTLLSPSNCLPRTSVTLLYVSHLQA